MSTGENPSEENEPGSISDEELQKIEKLIKEADAFENPPTIPPPSVLPHQVCSGSTNKKHKWQMTGGGKDPRNGAPVNYYSCPKCGGKKIMPLGQKPKP